MDWPLYVPLWSVRSKSCPSLTYKYISVDVGILTYMPIYGRCHSLPKFRQALLFHCKGEKGLQTLQIIHLQLAKNISINKKKNKKNIFKYKLNLVRIRKKYIYYVCTCACPTVTLWELWGHYLHTNRIVLIRQMVPKRHVTYSIDL